MSQKFPCLSSDIPHFSLTEIFPALSAGGTPTGQAISQLLAVIVTLAFATVGGLITGQFIYPFVRLFVCSFVRLFVS